MRTAVEVIRIAIDHNMSVRAWLVEVIGRQEKSDDVLIGTTLTALTEDKVLCTAT